MLSTADSDQLADEHGDAAALLLVDVAPVGEGWRKVDAYGEVDVWVRSS